MNAIDDTTVPERAQAQTHDTGLGTLERTLAYAREHDYTGWDYADGMSSRIRQALPFENKWVNLAFQETIKRSPVNVRPLFLVEKRRNFKGAALFTMASVNAFRLTGEKRHLAEAERLVEFMLENSCDGYAGFCGGHHHPLQELDQVRYPVVPSIVTTAYGVRALLAADEVGLGDGEYAAVARTAADFLFEDLGYEEFDRGARIDYRPTDTGEYYTLNSNAIGAHMLLDLYDRFGGERLREAAEGILDYVVSEQTEEGGWMYRDPPSASHLSMDNFHNGFIIEALLRHEEVVSDGRYDEAYRRGMTFYRNVLFEPDGAPNWDEESDYPRDAHAAGQGILLFAKAGDLEFAGRVLDWTLGALYAGDGRFYFRKQRFYTKRFTLMRWCEAWMAYAISAYLLAAREA